MTFGRICNSPAVSVSICNAKILIHWQSVCLLLGFRISHCKCFHSHQPNFKFGRTEKLGFFRPMDLILGAHRPDIQTVETVVVVVRVDAARAEAEVARAVGENGQTIGIKNVETSHDQGLVIFLVIVGEEPIYG